MKKLINSVDTVLSESLDGLVAAHSDILALDEEHRFGGAGRSRARSC